MLQTTRFSQLVSWSSFDMHHCLVVVGASHVCFFFNRAARSLLQIHTLDFFFDQVLITDRTSFSIVTSVIRPFDWDDFACSSISVATTRPSFRSGWCRLFIDLSCNITRLSLRSRLYCLFIDLWSRNLTDGFRTTIVPYSNVASLVTVAHTFLRLFISRLFVLVHHRSGKRQRPCRRASYHAHSW